MINKVNIAGLGLILISIAIIIYAYASQSLTLLTIGGTSILVSVFLWTMIASLRIFREDKNLDIEALEKAGFHPVECPECGKKNIIEDKFCIFCGSDLVETQEQV